MNQNEQITINKLLEFMYDRVAQQGIADRVEIKCKKSSEFYHYIEIHVDDVIYAQVNYYDNEGFIKNQSNPKLKASGSITLYNPPNSDIINPEVRFRVDISSIKTKGKIVNNVTGRLAELFPSPDDEKVRLIISCVKRVLGYEVNTDQVCFEFSKNTYYFKDSFTKDKQKLKQIFIPTIPKEICKYTTIETFFEILKHQCIRMNGLVAMNDTHETYFINNYLHPDSLDIDRIILNSEDILLFSFTELLDDLNMWRLYGDNAQGICMVFSTEEIDNNVAFKKVIYEGTDKFKFIENCKSVIDELACNDIKFEFKSLSEHKYFFKPKEYDYEKEYRLTIIEKDKEYYLNSTYKTLTPYKDYTLLSETKRSVTNPFQKNKTEKKVFPLKLKKIILGPNLPSIATNFPLLVKECMRRWGIEVEKSKLSTYR